MNETLKAYREQRALVAGHLQWLDEQIARLEGLEAQEPPVDESNQPDPATAVPLVEGGTPAPGADLPESVPESIKDPLSSVDPEGLGELPQSSQNDLARTRAGCVVAGVVGALLFLFLLFGLPYLIY